MHTFDIVVIIVFALFITIGIVKGFISELFHFAAMAGGLIGAFLFYPHVFELLGFLKIANQSKTVIAFIVTYIAFAFTLILTGWILKKIVHMTILGWIDRLCGALFGLGKGCCIVWIFVLSISLFPAHAITRSFSSSVTYTILSKIPFRLSTPDKFTIKESYDSLKKILPTGTLKKTKKTIDKVKDTMFNSFYSFSDSL